jgi:hypothetical protein
MAPLPDRRTIHRCGGVVSVQLFACAGRTGVHLDAHRCALMAEKWQKVDHALLFEVKLDRAVARTPAKRKIIDPEDARCCDTRLREATDQQE